MQQATAIAIQTAADHNGIDIRVYEGYAGRHMGGQKTDGIVYGSTGDLLAAVAAAAVMLAGSEALTPNEDPLLSADEFIQDIKKARFDNMGRQFIVY